MTGRCRGRSGRTCPAHGGPERCRMLAGHRSLADPRPQRRHGPGAGPRPRPRRQLWTRAGPRPSRRPAPGQRDDPDPEGPPAFPPLPVRRSTVPLRMDPVPPAATKTVTPPVPPQEGRCRESSARPVPCRPDPADDGEFHPPVPPPLPSLDPVAKGAWAGRCSAVLATCCWPPWSAGRSRAGPHSWPWPRSSSGFATLVIRMGDKPPRDFRPGRRRPCSDGPVALTARWPDSPVL